MKKLILTELDLKTFTEQDASDYCFLNNINPEDITELDLSDNQLTDISGIKLFKNLEELELYNNQIKNISVLKDLNKLKILDINDNKITDISVLKNLKNLIVLGIINLKLESDQIKYIKNLEYLWCKKGFKDMSVLKQLNKSNKMNEIFLSKLNLKIFTEQDAEDYCQLNGINQNNITVLYLYKNKPCRYIGY